MGQAALAHERIPDFPQVENPEHHILVAHCGYFGVVPQSFATDWSVEKKVLAIVDENAIALDAALPEGGHDAGQAVPHNGKNDRCGRRPDRIRAVSRVPTV